MAMTDGSVMPSSRAQGMKELWHPALLLGVIAYPAKARRRGQKQTRQFVSRFSSYPGMFIESDGGTCVLLLALWWETAVFLAKRQYRWLQMAIS